MNAEFNWWLLIVGLVVGAGLVWLVVLDSRRREVDLDAQERNREAAWLSAVLADDGFEVSPEAAGRLLEHHRRYLESPPPDPVDVDPETEDPDRGSSPEGSADALELSDDDGLGVQRGRVDLGQ